MVDFKNKIILITGGTGTIGIQLITTLLEKYSPRIIRVYSRDETKQFILSKKLSEHKKKLRFFIGDIRDKERLRKAMKDVNIVFHLAALKHVTACEYNPFEAIKTNIIGLQNVIDICIDNHVENCIFTSTDKAATPCNTMGVTKLMGEKLITAANYYKGTAKTIFYSVRFGNVLGSRGSLVPLVEEQIRNNKPIMLTHFDMTRYIMGVDTAIKLIIDTMDVAQGGEVFVLKMDTIRIIDLLEVLIKHFASKYEKVEEQIQIEEIGMLVGEKLYEELFSIEESERTYEIDNMFIIFPQLTEVSMEIDMNTYKNIRKFDDSNSYNSKEGPFISKEKINEFLIKYNII